MFCNTKLLNLKLANLKLMDENNTLEIDEYIFISNSEGLECEKIFKKGQKINDIQAIFYLQILNREDVNTNIKTLKITINENIEIIFNNYRKVILSVNNVDNLLINNIDNYLSC